MAITEQQRAQRTKHLGSSDVPAIMGFSRWASAYDIWLLKTGRVQAKEKTQDYVQAGNLLEEPVIKWCSEYLSEEIDTDAAAMERSVDGTPIVVHTDGILRRTGEPVEGKTEGLYGPIVEPWGESGTDEVPEYTCIQAHCHLMATDREVCHVPTFLGGRGFGYYFVQRDNKLVDLIRSQAQQFWQEHVLRDVPPEESVPTLAMAKRIRHIEGEPVELEAEIVQQWLEAKEDAKAAKKLVEYYQAHILATLDGCELGKYEVDEDGKMCERYVSHFEQKRKGYTVGPTSFRVLRVKKKL